MTIARYGITLERMQLGHIEMVRHWRNDPKIQQHMFYQAHITTEMQQSWYATVNNEHNFYFLIYDAGTALGLISLSAIDYDRRTAFAGLFVYDDRYLGTDIPVRASLCMLDAFFTYSPVETLYAKVLNTNHVADQYNTALGFEKIKRIELGLGYEYQLRREQYLSKAKLLRAAALKIYGDELSIEFSDDEMDRRLKEKFLAASVQEGL